LPLHGIENTFNAIAVLWYNICPNYVPIENRQFQWAHSYQTRSIGSQ
jgi:hypothetical protein